MLNSTVERRYLGFRLLEQFAEVLATDQITLLVTPNYIRCLMSNLHQSDKLLNKVARHSVRIRLPK